LIGKDGDWQRRTGLLGKEGYVVASDVVDEMDFGFI